jgi:PST family polysaccharide transporter
MKPNDQAKYLFRGTLILTIAALLTKVLSAFYRIPFQNIVGDVGFYIYQQVYPFYGMVIVLSTYGFPVVISKLYAEEKLKKEQGNLKQLFYVSALFLFSFGLLSFLLLYSRSEWLAHNMNDPQLAQLLRVISFVFLIMPIISLLRGFFQGAGEMVPTALSQVGEQFIRIITILATAIFLVQHHYSLYSVGVGAVFGSITGGVTSAIILFYFWLKKQSNLTLSGRFELRNSARIIKTLLVQALPICISSMLLIFIQLADSLNLYALLVQSGIGTELAKGLKGVYDRGQPLIQLGSVVATSMSLALVPLITKEKMEKNAVALKEKIRLALKTSILVGVGATMGLWSIIKPTNMMLFENAEGSGVLAVLTVIILLSSVILTVTAILQGLGHTLFPALAILGCFLLKYGLNVLLVPKLDTMGAAIASVLSLFLLLVVLLSRLHIMMGGFILSKRFYWMNGLAAFVMFLILHLFLYMTNFIYDLVDSDRIWASFQALIAVIIGGFTYVVVIIRANLLKEAELSYLPLGSKLMLFLPKGQKKGRTYEKD